MFVTLADEAYVDAAKQLFSSVHRKGGWTGDYLLLAHRLSPTQTKWFAQRGILVHHCEPLFGAEVGGQPAVLASKLHLFTAPFRRWRSVVYCDADSSVRGSLDRLCAVDGFWAVPDVSGWLDVQVLPAWLRWRRRIDAARYRSLVGELARYDLMSRPFCAGFFAFSTDVIRPQTFTALKETLERYEPISRYGDQLAFNLFFHRHWNALPAVYNVQVRPGRNQWRLAPSQIDGLVVHHSSRAKPWQTRGAFYPEWRMNLELADRIDVTSTPPAVTWSDDRIRDYSVYLDSRDCVTRVRKLTANAERVGGRLAARAVRLAAQTAVKALPPTPPGAAPRPSEFAARHPDDGARAPAPYLVCTTPRTGSTLLCLLLARTAVAGMQPAPVFGWEPLLDLRIGPGAGARCEDPSAYLARVLSHTATPNGVRGFKVMWGQAADLGQDLPPVLPPDTRYVWLVRADRLRQAVSWSRAIQTQCWDSPAQREFAGFEVFDPRHIRSLLAEVDRQTAEWEALFKRHGIDPLRIRYEELVGDPQAVARKVLDYLNICAPDSHSATADVFERQADEVTDAWARRFQRIEASSSLAQAWHLLWGFPRRALGLALGVLRRRRWLRTFH